MKKVLLPVTGGIESSVLWYQLLDEGWEVIPLFFYFNNESEYSAVKDLGCKLQHRQMDSEGVQEGPNVTIRPCTIVSLSGGLWSIFGRKLAMPFIMIEMVGRAWKEEAEAICLNVTRAQKESPTGRILVGLLLLVLGILKFLRPAKSIALLTPFALVDKASAITAGTKLAVPLQLTWSCECNDSAVHCGTCSGCTERKAGFEQAKVPDPTLYSR
jgi:hypothetical protein